MKHKLTTKDVGETIEEARRVTRSAMNELDKMGLWLPMGAFGDDMWYRRLRCAPEILRA